MTKCKEGKKPKHVCSWDLLHCRNPPHPSSVVCFSVNCITFGHSKVHSSERRAATHVVWRGSAMGGISRDGWCIFLTAYLCVWVMAPPLREIQLELEISGQCWLPAHSHRPGSVSSTSGSVWAQEEKVRRKQTAEGLESWDRHGNGLRKKVHEAAMNLSLTCKSIFLYW